jgi:hypothetical protein
VRLRNIRLSFTGGGTREDAALTPPELDAGYPEPSRIGTMPAYGLFARHVQDLELEDVRFTFENDDLRPALVCDDVKGLEIDDFKAQLAGQTAAAAFTGVTNVVVRNSPVLEGMTSK